MNFFLISNMYPDASSPGYGVFVKNIVKGLKKHELNCTYKALIIGRPKSLSDKLSKYFKFYMFIILHYFKKHDFIYMHFPNQALPILIPLYFLKRKKIIINLHGEDLLYNQQGLSLLLGKLNDWFMPKADGVVVPSSYYKDVLLGRNKSLCEKIIISPSGGYNPLFFHATPKNFSKNTIHLGYVGRIDKDKGWREFIEMTKYLPSPLNYEATIIGAGAQISDLHNLIKDRMNKIRHITNVAQDRLELYYSSFDLLIFPSSRKEESLGLVGIEAMACGTPVIGFNVGGISSYLIDGYNGYLVQIGDVKGLAIAVLKYTSLSINKKQNMFNNCIASSKKYSTDNVSRELSTEIKKYITTNE